MDGSLCKLYPVMCVQGTSCAAWSEVDIPRGGHWRCITTSSPAVHLEPRLDLSCFVIAGNGLWFASEEGGVRGPLWSHMPRQTGRRRKGWWDLVLWSNLELNRELGSTGWQMNTWMKSLIYVVLPWLQQLIFSIFVPKICNWFSSN